VKVKTQTGAVAAFVQAAGNIWILILLLALLPSLGAKVYELGDVAKASRAESQPLFWISTAAVDLVEGVTLILIALALLGLLRSGTLVRIGTAVGGLAALAWVAGAILSLSGGSHLASLYASDPASAAAAFTSTTAPEQTALAVGRALVPIWTAIFFGSALSQRALPAPLCYLAIILAVIGIVSVVIPPARLLAAVVSIALDVWLGLVLLRTTPSTSRVAASGLRGA
jgi:hypothetical protein